MDDGSGAERRLTAEKIVLAPGSTPARIPDVDFNDETVFDSDGILRIRRIPDSVVVVGAGVIGIEYASMFAALGSKVTVVDGRATMLDFCDPEIIEALRYHLRDLGVIFRFGEIVTAVGNRPDGTITELASGKQIAADAVFYSAGRVGATADLRLEQVGLEVDERGRIAVDSRYRTAVEHIYAVGDVIGFPSLASTSAEQGRIASCDACGSRGAFDDRSAPVRRLLDSRDQLRRQDGARADRGRDSVRGRRLALPRARPGQILGETHGLVKLLVSSVDHTLLGVHAIGAQATEVVHVGQAVMGLGGTVDYLVDTVFNYPTLAEAYKVAALDASNKLRAVSVLASGSGAP